MQLVLSPFDLRFPSWLSTPEEESLELFLFQSNHFFRRSHPPSLASALILTIAACPLPSGFL